MNGVNVLAYKPVNKFIRDIFGVIWNCAAWKRSDKTFVTQDYFAENFGGTLLETLGYN